MRMTKREIIGMSVLLIVILVYFGDQLLYQPLKLRKIRLANEQSQIIQELEEIDAQQNRNRDLLSLEPQIKQDYQKVITQIPAEPMISDTVRYLEWSATQSNVKIASCAVKDEKDKPKVPGGNDHQAGQNGELSLVELQVIARGSRYHLMSFLLQIDNSPRLMIIDDLSWSVGSPTDGSNPPGTGSNGSDEAEKTGDVLNEGETETLTVGLTFYCKAGKHHSSP